MISLTKSAANGPVMTALVTESRNDARTQHDLIHRMIGPGTIDYTHPARPGTNLAWKL